MSLKQKTVLGVGWSMVEKFSTLLIQLLSTLIIARSLGPEDFGLLGMLTIFMAMGQVVLDSGFGQALIRKDNTTTLDYSSVFYVNICIGVVLYALFYTVAPLIAEFFNTPKLERVAKVIFLIFPINSLGLIQFTILNKKIDFKSLSKVTILSAVISGIIGVSIAVIHKTVWALVCQNLFFYVFRTCFLWMYSSWRPIFKFSYQSIKSISSLSYNLLLTGLIGSIFNNMYNIIIGKCYSSVELGYYSQADRFQKIPSTSITEVIQRVTYSVFSVLKDDRSKLRESFIKIVAVTFFIITPIMIYLVIVSENLFEILLTSKWNRAAIYFKYLCFVGVLFPLSSLSLNILTIDGKGSLILILEFVRKSMLMIILLITYNLDMIALMYGLVFYSIAQLILNCFYSFRIIKINILSFFKRLLPTVFCVFIAAVITALMELILKNNSKIILIFFQLLVFFCVYILCSKVLRISALEELLKIVSEKIKFKE